MGRWTSCVLISAALFAGCGSDDEDTGSESAGGSTAAAAPAIEPSKFCGSECQAALKLTKAADEIECKVGVSWNSAEFPYGAVSLQRAKEAAKSFPKMELFESDGRGDAATQTGQIEDLLARGIDVLVISPLDAKALAGVVKRAQDEGVKVITADRTVDGDVTTYVGSDNVEAGEVAGKFIVEQLPEGGSVVELQGTPGASPTIDRGKGFKDALSGSNVKIIGGQSGDYNKAEGLKVMEDFLQRFGPGKIDAVFAHNDEMSLGAIQAIKEAGREGEIKVVGIDGQESALTAVEDGSYAGTVVYPITMPESIIAAAKACAGEELPKRLKQDSQIVTNENVSEYKGTTF